MAWIVPIPPSARHPHERYQVCFLDGKRHRSAGIFATKRRALTEKRALDRGPRGAAHAEPERKAAVAAVAQRDQAGLPQRPGQVGLAGLASPASPAPNAVRRRST